MTPSTDDWGALKSAWRATPHPAVDVASLRASVRWRTALSWAYLALEVSAGLLLVFLVMEQWRMGQRGVAAALALLTAASVAASVWVRRLALPPSDLTVLGMVDLAIAQAHRGTRFANATYVTIAASVAYVAVMYTSGIGAADAAYRDPGRVLAVLVVFALSAAATALYRRRALARWHRLRGLRAQMTGSDPAPLAGEEGDHA
jgi:hypothetical protein